jgi:protein gp37
MADATVSLPLLANVWLGTSVENADYLWRLDDLRRTRAAIRFASFEPLLGSVGDASLGRIDWAIVGGESGPRARPMMEVWVSEIRDRCRAAGTAFFFKQWGGKNKKRTGRLLEGRTWDEFPARSSPGRALPFSARA